MRTVTFYSYKGGTGRTLLMANIAIAAVQLGRRVVVLDLDLEAPGLAYKLRPQAPAELRGAVDWLAAFRDDQQPQVEDYTVSCEVRREPIIAGGELLMIPAGRAPSPQYFDTLSRLHLDEWIEAGGVVAFQSLKQAIYDRYEPDFLVIDSRTGITATNSVTTRVLADAVVALTLDSPEQLDGTRSVLRTLQPLTSLETGESLDLHVVLSRFAADSKPDDPSARTSEEQRALNSVQRFLTEPAWPARNTLDISLAKVHLIRMDAKLAGREFVVLDQPERYRGSLFEENLGIAASVLSGLVGSPESAEIARQLESVHARGRTADWMSTSSDKLDQDLLGQAETLRQALAEDPRVKAALAALLMRIATASRDLGNTSQSLESNEEAVLLYRELAEADPAVNTPDLAMAVNNYANRLAEAGRRDEALEFAREALDLRRELAASNPSAFAPSVAKSVANYAVRLAEVGRREEALGFGQEAVDLYRGLAAGNPAAYTPDLAMAVNNYANHLAEAGRREEALGFAQEAVDLYRGLAAGNPAAYTPDLAASVNNYAVGLAEVGRREEALGFAKEAVDLRRGLAATNPAAYAPDLAASVNNYANRLAEAECRNEALGFAQEAVDLYRGLARANLAAYTPDMAKAVSNYAVRLAEAGRREEALGFAQEAVALYRGLAADNPAAYTSDLAMSVNNNAVRLADVGQPEEALQFAQEAVDLFKRLAVGNDLAYRHRLELAQKTLESILQGQ